MLAIMRKELADLFNSARFLVLFMLVLVASGLGVMAVRDGIRAALEQNFAITGDQYVFLALFTASFPKIAVFNFASVISLIGPIIGISLGFDAINSERTGGTMSRLLAQPVYRDNVINGKFLAGLIALALMIGTAVLLMAGFGIRMIGVPPTAEEIIRLFIYFVVTVFYGAFWIGLAMLCSVIFRRASGSLLIPILVFVLFFIWIFLASVISPVDDNAPIADQLKSLQMQSTLQRVSPSFLYQEAFSYLLSPVFLGVGIISVEQASYIIPNPLSLGQVILEIWPHIVALVSLSIFLFAISYIVFMKQEIRAT